MGILLPLIESPPEKHVGKLCHTGLYQKLIWQSVGIDGKESQGFGHLGSREPRMIPERHLCMDSYVRSPGEFRLPIDCRAFSHDRAFRGIELRDLPNPAHSDVSEFVDQRWIQP